MWQFGFRERHGPSDLISVVRVSIIPRMDSQPQQQLDFFSPKPVDGYAVWIQERQAKINQWAQQLGLPLGQTVEIWLRGGIRLRGRLLMREEKIYIPAARDLSIELVVNGVQFRPGEVESCVRLD